MNLTILINAEFIPNGSTVYKANGTTKYIIKDKIDVYTLENKKETISTKDCKFLISDNGSINAISTNTILKWETDLETLNFIFGDDE